MNNEYSEMAANGIIRAAQEQFYQVLELMTEPSVLYRPTLSIDGDKWCALYGENLQDGVAGFGDSPYAAMCDFNCAWHAKLKKQQEAAGHEQ